MDGTQYIGSKISLISNADIRYLGTLYSIDASASTLRLQNVTIMGTEGRKANPAEEIAKFNAVYSFVDFGAADVKDLTVVDPNSQPEPAPPVPELNDPAVLMSSFRPPPAPHPSSQQPGGYYGPPPPLGPQFPITQGTVPPNWSPYGPHPPFGMGGWNMYPPGPPMMHFQPPQPPMAQPPPSPQQPQQQQQPQQPLPQQQQPQQQGVTSSAPAARAVTPSAPHSRGAVPTPPNQGRASQPREAVVTPKPVGSPRLGAPGSRSSTPIGTPSGITGEGQNVSWLVSRLGVTNASYATMTAARKVNGNVKSTTPVPAAAATPMGATGGQQVKADQVKVGEDKVNVLGAGGTSSVFAAPMTAMEMLTAQFGDVGIKPNATKTPSYKPATPQPGLQALPDSQQGQMGLEHGKPGQNGVARQTPGTSTPGVIGVAQLEQSRGAGGGGAMRHPLPALPRGPSAFNGVDGGPRQPAAGGGGGRRRGGRRQHTKQRTPSMTFATPGLADDAMAETFDYVESTRAFVSAKTGDAQAAGDEPLYDHKKSFFDDISSEIKERTTNPSRVGVGAGRGAYDRGAERDLNRATFGDAAMTSGGGGGTRSRARGRGRGRGWARGRGAAA